MLIEEKKSLPIQVKVSPNAKEKIGQRAKAADLNVSEYIRVAAISDEKVVFLNGSGSIAKSLAEININLDRALRGREITTELEDALLEKFGDIYNIFYEILEKLSDISNIEEILEV
ncbi:hypothetical protein [Ruminococcus flavefaciens]|uniref:plasmid mobilization protein n=1 Tax=Ruminococcus flavefaciens TaxID=1265 RepID=UPI0026EC38EE|nr:hypothetical protein [Ruminococcus flavefaciens]